MVCESHRALQSQARETLTNPRRASPMQPPAVCSMRTVRRQPSPRSRQRHKERLAISQPLPSPPFLFTLRDRDVAIDRQSRKPLRPTAGPRPLDLNPIDGLALPEPQHDSRIVVRKIAPASDLEPRALQISGFVLDLRADRVDVRFFAYQPNAQPMVLLARQIVQQNRRAAIYGNQDIHCAIIVEISQRQPAR